jgi:uncharacterized protein YigA (DUF484 family)
MTDRHLEIIMDRLAELANDNQMLARQVFDLTKRLEVAEESVDRLARRELVTT